MRASSTISKSTLFWSNLVVFAILFYVLFLSLPWVTDVGYEYLRLTAVRAEAQLQNIIPPLEQFHREHSRYPTAAASGSIFEASLFIETGAYYLTTPVAYLSVHVFDPFVGSGFVQPFRYYSDGTQAFVLASNGPDGDIDFKGQSMKKISLERWMYDPSNGNLSGGDVLVAGP